MMQDVGQQNRQPEQIKQKDKREILEGDGLHDRVMFDVLEEKLFSLIIQS